MSKTLNRWIVPGLAALGLADAAYLAILHLEGAIPPCNGYAGCETVNTSVYAEVFGVPVALLGSLLYVLILAAALVRVRSSGLRWGQASLALYGLAVTGAVFMAYLTGIELFVLHAICYWCVALALDTLVLLVLSSRDVWLFPARK